MGEFIPPEGVEFRLGRPLSTTESGVPYVTFVNQALVPEGEAPPNASTIEDAWIAFNATVSKYLRENQAKVVEWRVAPYDDSDAGRHRVRARLAIVEQHADEEAA